MNCQVSFGRVTPELYDEVYEKRPKANGTRPDVGIINLFRRTSPQGCVADIGAGYGRNSIPLAIMGYQVDAFEISERSRQMMAKASKDNPNLKILGDDILDKPLEKGRYDMILMSHVSQHFTENELGDAIGNFFQGLKKGGLAVFDALLNKNSKLPESPSKDVTSGQAYYKEQTIMDLATKHNFEVQTKPYNKRFDSGSDYLGPLWGFGDKTHPQFRPVKLNWFFLRKP